MTRLRIRERSGRIREKIQWRHMYTFDCVQPATDPNLNLESIGYSRIVHLNNPEIHHKPPLSYHGNYISTSKYSLITFLPKALFEQFRRVANLYFLLTAIFSYFPVSPSKPVTVVLPLLLVVGFSMAKDGLEDWKRHKQDAKVNSRHVSVYNGNGGFVDKTWMDIRVGDVVKVEKDQFFPADLLFLSSSFEDGICYVETMNLDGETNLKVKRTLEATLIFDDETTFKDFTGMIKCENPNASLYTFSGNLEFDHQVFSIDPSQILLRDSKLRNTTYIYGVVIFTGHESKVMQNATESPSKRSTVERRMDQIIIFLFIALVMISVISSTGFAVMLKVDTPNWWYLQPLKTESVFDPSNPLLSGLLHFVTALMLYGYLLPISLYVSIEFVKLTQAKFINQDLQMYDEETGNAARARTSNLNEELGQVDTILTDKTGTLTCNQMDFLKCSIAGVSYGTRISEVELAAAKMMNSQSEDAWENIEDSRSGSKIGMQKEAIKGFTFEDERLMQGNWMKQPNQDVLLMFFRILALCHTAIPEPDEQTGSFTYEAESPDEAAFLLAAREFGFEFCKRTQTSVFTRERYPSVSHQIEREFKVLNLLEFNSKRKRMSVVVKDETGKLLLLCKGADTIIFDRLAKNGRQYLEDTTRHLNDYGEGGLRTLALSYRELDDAEYAAWNAEFVKAKTNIGPDRDALLEQVSEMIERDLILVGATAVEDKLQKGVPQCIDKLAQAGLKIWVLTGDKMETAINIGFACSLLRQGMKQICISTMNTELLSKDAKKGYVLNLVTDEAMKENISLQITNASQMIKLETDPYAAFALIIDGKSLVYALEDDMKQQFLCLAVDCSSVICCRVSPKQKALVTRLVKDGTGKTTLAIGDGANDVGMIQEADIGVGISGVEGMQAVMASDFSIAQFRYLERLLVVHGHWCYKRVAQMICYFFYKNIAFGLTLFYFEILAGFSGQTIYDEWFMTMFNVFLTSMPVLALGVFEQDVSAEICLQFPALYQQGPQNLFFGWYRVIGWFANGLYVSLVTFFMNTLIFIPQSLSSDAKIADMAAMGATMFTCVIWSVNVQIALSMSHFTWMQHASVWGSISAWYSIMVAYGFYPNPSNQTYKLFLDVLAPAPSYWAATLLVTMICNLPYLTHISLQRMFHPEDHHVIQEIKYYKKDVEDEHMWQREKSKARQRTQIGFTARVDERIRHIKEKLHAKVSCMDQTKQLHSSLHKQSPYCFK